MAYVPPHRRKPKSSHVITLDSLVAPDDSISNVGASDANLDITQLSEVQVAALLSALGLGRYAEAARGLPLRGRDLVHCREEDLEAIGFAFRPHRISFLEEVARFSSEGVPAHLLEAAVHLLGVSKLTPLLKGDGGFARAQQTHASAQRRWRRPAACRGGMLTLADRSGAGARAQGHLA